MDRRQGSAATGYRRRILTWRKTKMRYGKFGDEFLNLVIEMRKAQTRCKFGRAPSFYKARDAAEKKVDDYLGIIESREKEKE